MQFNTEMMIAAVVGFIVGALLIWLISSTKQKSASESQSALQKEKEALQKEYNQYRDEVNAHFAKTADAVDNLTKSYQDVFAHLSDGAQHLMDKEALQAQLKKREGKAVTLAYLVDKNTLKQVDEKSVVSTKPSTPQEGVQKEMFKKERDVLITAPQKETDKQAHKTADFTNEAPKIQATPTKYTPVSNEAGEAKSAEAVKTPAQIAAEKAGFSFDHINGKNTQAKVAPSVASKKETDKAVNVGGAQSTPKAGEAPIKLGAVEEESAIDSVKRHLRNNSDKTN